ncbi:beta-ketoacyl synthase N-terminal-like domain-containing protein [Anatilimnocola floriformis]|uniref:beta-ketoacyl synthase N-terminal-like domain-containing protein n=1 Tax=Anatilimnocola floriformis TaxID=2948575 RepID=UPI0020C42D98|nr:beta-ketoacyl synthase N-terminal-like domain-containing protein [Anatilimnocola floriformis]
MTFGSAIQVMGWGYARMQLAEFAGLRRSLPAWAVEGTPGHFFKHADEQSMLAAQAVDDAIQRHGFDPKSLAKFGVLAAPRFLGRAAGEAVIRRYRRDGAQGVTPHIISQHSLHSVSGAISVLLGCQGPNVGVGGGPHVLDDAFVTLLTMFGQLDIPGVLLVGTGWDPEPIIDQTGNCTNEPECFAFALIAQPAGQERCGSLQLRTESSAATTHPEITTPQLVRQLQAADVKRQPLQLTWNLNWGAAIEVELAQPAQSLVRAA